MKNVIRCLLLTIAFSFAGSALAELSKVPNFAVRDPEAGNFYGPSPSAACSALGAAIAPRTTTLEGSNSCKVMNASGAHIYSLAVTETSPVCPGNSTESGSSCVCNSGFIEEGGQCVAELSNEAACGAAFYNAGSFNQEAVRLEGNVNDGAYCQEMGDSIKPGLACTMRFDKHMAWKTDDGKWFSEGTLQPQIIGGKFQPCVPGIDGSGDPADPEVPKDLPKKQDPTCPNGYKGSVGGEERCIPSYGYNGVDFAPKTKYTENDKTRTETTTKTECALGKCTTTVTEKVTDKETGNVTTTESSTTEQDRDWCNKPENKNSCASNGKPSYSGHDTGYSGGGGGNGDGEDKGGSCGGVNQPPCRIDEKGTPDGKDAFDSLLDKQAQDHQQRMDALNSIKSTSDKDTSLGFSGGFQWLTHKSCMPWNLGTMQIGNYAKEIEVNICAIEGIIAPVMNFLWILGTLFATIARVGAVMGARIE